MLNFDHQIPSLLESLNPDPHSMYPDPQYWTEVIKKSYDYWKIELWPVVY
jgi:hypothetical protein